MWHAGQAGATGNIESGSELGGAPATLVVAQPEPDHMSRPVTGMTRRQPGQDPGVQRVTDPVCCNDDGDTDARLLRGCPRLVQDDLQNRSDAPDEGRV